MKKIVITLDDEEQQYEAHLRLPIALAEKVRFPKLQEGLKSMFSKMGLEVIHLEEMEEIRHQMRRRWDDPPSNE